MFTTKSLLLSSIVSLSFSGVIHAQANNYDVELARVQMNLKCEISGDNGGSTDCSIDLKSRGKQAITMEESKDPKSPGFTGVDSVMDTNGMYLLAISADTTKAVQNVTMMRMQQGSAPMSFDVSLASSVTNSTTAVNISPLSIVMDNTKMTINLTVVAYAPASTKNIVTASSTTELVDYVLKTIQPAIQAAKKQ